MLVDQGPREEDPAGISIRFCSGAEGGLHAHEANTN